MMGARLAAVWMAGIVLAAGVAQAATYYLDGDQQIDGTAPVQIALTNAVGAVFTVDRTGDGSAGDPWTFDFSVLTNVEVIDLGAGMLYCADNPGALRFFQFNVAGASIAGVSSTAIRTWKGVEKRRGDHVAINSVNELNLGGIHTSTTRTSGGASTLDPGVGNIAIGSASDRAQGNVQIAFLYAYNENNSRAGDIEIYGDGDVLIAQQGNAGDVLTFSTSGTQNCRGGDVTINHSGNFLINDINTSHRITGGGGTGHRSGSISLDGGNSQGNATILGNVQTHHPSAQRNNAQAELGIQNYNNVTIEGDIIGHYYGSSTIRGLDVVIETGITGDIILNGDIDLRNGNEASYGQMRLAANGDITLASLDLSKVGYAYLSTGGSSLIEGEIAHFVTDGSEDRLRAPSGQKIYYDYEAGVLNDHLLGQTWQLKDLGGVTDGGLLVSFSEMQPTGTVIRFR